MGTGALAGVQASWWYVLLACSGALLVYHIDRAFNIPQEDLDNVPQRVSWFSSHRFYVLFSSLFAVLAGSVSARFLPKSIIIVGAGLGVLGILYGVKVPGMQLRIKDLPFIKTLLIVLCWIMGSVVLPFESAITPLLLSYLVVYKALAILPNILVADWMDREGDKKHGILSSGVWIGWNGVRYLTLGCMVCSVLLVILITRQTHMLWLGAIDLTGLAIITAGVWRGSRNNLPDIVYFDLLIGLSFVTWLVWLVVY